MTQPFRRYLHPHQFAGVTSTIGNAIGRLVYQSVLEAASKPGERVDV